MGWEWESSLEAGDMWQLHLAQDQFQTHVGVHHPLGMWIGPWSYVCRILPLPRHDTDLWKCPVWDRVIWIPNFKPCLKMRLNCSMNTHFNSFGRRPPNQVFTIDFYLMGENINYKLTAAVESLIWSFFRKRPPPKDLRSKISSEVMRGKVSSEVVQIKTEKVSQNFNS